MQNVAGFPYFEARFDKNGATQSQITLPAGTTDLFVVSHGWNNTEEDARKLYREFFESFKFVAPAGTLAGRQCAVVGVIWPSKKFDETVAVEGNGSGGGGSASLDSGDDADALRAVEQKLDRMKEIFTESDQLKTIDEARALLPDLETKEAARREFADKIRSLLDREAATKGDASEKFFKTDGNELMKDLKVAEDDADDELLAGEGGASLPLGVGNASGVTGGAAGFLSFLTGFKTSAMNVLNYTTYYVMKQRAGTVGKNGVARLVDQLAPKVQRIHLIGHSFGGRVVTATAANSATDKIKSMTLLQAAFSHNGFSTSMGGFFRSVVEKKRVNGPILITHTRNDKAVGTMYPLASRINGDKTAAFGDENDKFGGIGRNGAQKTVEAVAGELADVGFGYRFKAGSLFNLKADKFITHHGDVVGKQIAYAVAVAVT